MSEVIQPADPTEQSATSAAAVNDPSASTVGNDGVSANDESPDAPQVSSPAPAAPAAPAAPEAPKPEPGKPLGNDAPKLDSLQNKSCPSCTSGVLYVTRYDPFALHEAGQGTALAKGHESGGAYDIRCANCDYTESRAFNPGDQWGSAA